MDPKEYSKEVRERFLAPPSDFRYGRLNGASVQKRTSSRYYSNRTPHAEWEMKAPVSQEFLDYVKKTPILHPLTTGLDISLNKQKRWETYPEALQAADPLAIEHKAPEQNVRSRVNDKVETTSFAFGPQTHDVEDDISDDFESYNAEEFKADYVKDRFSRKIMQTEQHKQYWRSEKLRPKNINDPRIYKLRLSSRSVGHGSNVANASITYHQHHPQHFASGVWIPKSDERADDYLEVDMLKNHIVTAVGTKGRPAPMKDEQFYYNNARKTQPRYSKKVDVSVDNQWVQRYVLSFREEKRGSQWVEIGEFRANSDRCTEVAHKLNKVSYLDPNNNTLKETDSRNGARGIIARYLRFRPLNKNTGGYHGKKAMRVSVYGVPYIKQVPKKNEFSDGEEESEQNSTNHSISGIGTKIPGVKVTLFNTPDTEETNMKYEHRKTRRGSIDDLRHILHRRNRRVWKRLCKEEEKIKSLDCFTISVQQPRVYFSWKGFHQINKIYTKLF